MHPGRSDRADRSGNRSQQMGAAGRPELTISKCGFQGYLLGARYQVVAQPRKLVEKSARDEDTLWIEQVDDMRDCDRQIFTEAIQFGANHLIALERKRHRFLEIDSALEPFGNSFEQRPFAGDRLQAPAPPAMALPPIGSERDV